ncbi:hypothetical protein SPRG_04833 [Saprolegnia parasitica CBS 223.65]|uniref:Myb-like domain-containing protein n=1 Tax=Saprolegnia parasitica (strain CBS 223.65) TaxID=695850 RepID=A0A067CNV1_SAPPC|nr:hypothetical protein SPRG_04833 [Saprolegnia parasitica CBS 223.65]KDO30930.1 hypothetical protein SPRG_04833 [Saprolegnia parasitica CBS 223.65]|eukprot:XP_012198621.1 hypothetical protein SPRG_04833 [Saprolegnia parasitica CBS 223.65]
MYRSPEWTDGDDVILLREVARDRPFLARYGLVAGAWTSLAAKVVATEGFTRTNFSSTKAQVRFTTLISNHRSETETSLLDSKCSEVCFEKRSLLDTLLPLWSSRKARADKKTPRTTDADSQRRKDTKGPTPASNCDVDPLRRDEAQADGQKRGDDNNVQERDFELRQEDLRQEDLRQEDLRQEELHREELHHEKRRREELRQDALRREERRQEEQRLGS